MELSFINRLILDWSHSISDPLHVFKYAEIASVLLEEKLIMQITLPIAEREQNQLYKATPIPIETPNGRLITKISQTSTRIKRNSSHCQNRC